MLDRETRFPESVYELGEWLKAHPLVKRVKLPNGTFARYMSEVGASVRITPSYDPLTPVAPVLMWRHQQAMIPESDWHRRELLFPARIWRKA
jgi:hypothetical protein